MTKPSRPAASGSRTAELLATMAVRRGWSGPRGSLNSKSNKGPNPRCPDCQNEMRVIDRTCPDSNGGGSATIWQCPVCSMMSTRLP